TLSVKAKRPARFATHHAVHEPPWQNRRCGKHFMHAPRLPTPKRRIRDEPTRPLSMAIQANLALLLQLCKLYPETLRILPADELASELLLTAVSSARA
ncbi:MAG: hypothetical protein KJ702_00020, partial [Gammaproteobacteria bacterium]|nr:hypothetical protein [Gammaproteobacteria bacterium]